MRWFSANETSGRRLIGKWRPSDRHRCAAMIDTIYAIKFVHLLAAAAMFGTWLCIALFMLLAHRSGNTAVVALTSRFVFRVEMIVMAAALLLLPLSGFPLASAVGLSPVDEFWIVLAVAVYGVVVIAWLAAVFVERRIRNVTREAALSGAPLPNAYPRLFRVWCVLAVLILAGMIALFVLMIWQPRPS
jgi:uncharacterized membrane protein